MLSHPRISRAFYLGLLLAFSSGQADAERPSVVFDFGSTAECRELTLPESAGIYPGEKIVELKLRISVHLTSGKLEEEIGRAHV